MRASSSSESSTSSGDDFIPSLDTFADIWTRSTDALAFVDPNVMDAVKATNIPFRLRAFDGKSFVITRSVMPGP